MTPTRRLLILSGVILGGGVLTSCVLPDRYIQIVDENIQNKHPVRLVEPTPLSFEAQDACDDGFKGKLLICQPGEPELVLPHFLDPTYADPKEQNALVYNFCSCAVDEEGSVQLNSFPLYVEDRADDVDKELSKIYMAALLDVRPESTDPQNSVRYRDHIDPLQPLDLDDQLNYTPLKRPDPKLRVLNFGGFRTIDLCNNAIDAPLSRGFHTLTIIVTDRPWFKAPPEEGEEDDKIQAGVPDIAGGATFDTTSYIFHCDDKTDLHCTTECAKPMVDP